MITHHRYNTELPFELTSMRTKLTQLIHVPTKSTWIHDVSYTHIENLYFWINPLYDLFCAIIFPPIVKKKIEAMKFVIEWWIYTHTPFGLSLKKGDKRMN